MNAMDEPPSTADGSGSVDPDGAPGAQPLAESTPATQLLLLLLLLLM